MQSRSRSSSCGEATANVALQPISFGGGSAERLSSLIHRNRSCSLSAQDGTYHTSPCGMWKENKRVSKERYREHKAEVSFVGNNR